MQKFSEIGIWFVLVILIMGCAGDPAEQVPEKAPTPQVNLPDTPSLVAVPIKERTESGDYTVAGIFKNAPGKFGQMVQVTAVVADRQNCLPEKKGEEALCNFPPHLILVDGLVLPGQQLKVVGSVEQIEALVPVDGRVTVSGILKQWNDDPDPTFDKFFVDSRGLIQLPPPPVPSEESAL